jgi:hypothetical protein
MIHLGPRPAKSYTVSMIRSAQRFVPAARPLDAAFDARAARASAAIG